MRKFLVLAGLWVLAGAAMAQAQPPDAGGVPATQPSAPVAPVHPLPPERNWRLGIGVGYGKRTNPLIQSEDIPVIVDIDVAWFGKRWFFDNGDIGFSVYDGDRATTNLVARVNSDRAFFGKTNKKYVTLAQVGGGVQAPAYDGGTLVTNPVELDPPDRDYAIELGVETLLDGEWGSATVRAFHDVSKAHEGYEISADWSYRVVKGRFSISPALGVAYKSAKLNDYFWGVRRGESSAVLPEYHPNAGFGWEASLRANYYVTKNIRIAVSGNYERLQDDVAHSPLVDDDYVYAYFTGLVWSF